MATVNTPWAAIAWFSRASLSRSPLFHAPPWTSTTVGNGSVPIGRYTRANQGSSPWRWYSTSLTSTSNSTLVAIRAVYTRKSRLAPPPRGSLHQLSDERPRCFLVDAQRPAGDGGVIFQDGFELVERG